jgi:hypothetical protein
MKDVLVILSLVLALGAGAVAGYGFFERTRQVESLNRAIDKLRSRLDASENTTQELRTQTQEIADSSVTPQMVEREMAELRNEVSAVTMKVERQELAIGEMAEAGRNRTAQVAKLSRMVQNAPAAGGGSSVRTEDIEELIEEKLKQRQPMGKEPHLSAVAARIGLEEVERKALEDILRQKKNELMTVLKTPRADGSCMADEIADLFIGILKSGDPEGPEAKKKAQQFWVSLTKERVPGTDKTYFEEGMRIHQETRQAFKESLSEKQYQAFEALGIENAGDIKIDDDPLGAYVLQRAKEAGVEIPGQ